MHRVHARVVELDALPDPVRPGAQDQHLRPVRRRDLGLLVVASSSGTAWSRRTRPRRCPPSCRPGAGRAGAAGSRTPSSAASSGRSAASCRSDRPARLARRSRRRRAPAASTISVAQLDQGGDLVQEPRVDPAGRRGDLGDRRAEPQRPLDGVEPAVVRDPQRGEGVLARVGAGRVRHGPETGGLGLHRAHRLVQRLGEVAARGSSPRRPTSSWWSAPGRRRGTSRTRTGGSSPPRSPAPARTPPGSSG